MMSINGNKEGNKEAVHEHRQEYAKQDKEAVKITKADSDNKKSKRKIKISARKCLSL